MSITDITLLLKDDFDAVYEAGKSAGGGTEITEPYAIYRGIAANGTYEECETFNMIFVPTNFIRQHSGIKKAIINEGVTVLNNASIYNCASLTTVILPSTLQTLNANALGSNSKLNNLFLPKSIVSMQATTLLNCSGLISIDVEPGFNCNLYLNTCANVSKDSVLNILSHYKEKCGRTLTLHANVADNWTQEELQQLADYYGVNITKAT